jgi:hypothetical protein
MIRDDRIVLRYDPVLIILKYDPVVLIILKYDTVVMIIVKYDAMMTIILKYDPMVTIVLKYDPVVLNVRQSVCVSNIELTHPTAIRLISQYATFSKTKGSGETYRRRRR